MADLVRGPNGEYGVFTPGTGVQTISQEEYEQLQKGRVGRFVGAMGDAVQDSVAGAIEGQFGGSSLAVPLPGVSQLGAALDAVGMNPVADLAGDVAAQNDPRQEARRSVDPFAATAGTIAEVAAEVAIPGAPALRGARVNRMSDPARRVVSSAEEVVAANRAREGAESFAGSPAFNPAGPGGASGARELSAGARFRRKAEDVLFPDADPKVNSVDAADRLGIPLTPGMRRGSAAQQTAEEGMTRQPGALEVFNREIAEPTQDAITGYVRRAFGLEDGTKLTRDDFAKGSDAISAEFGQIAEDMTGKYLVNEADVGQMKNVINSATRDNRVRQKVRRSWVDPYEGEAAERMADQPFSEARLSPKDIWGQIRELNTAIAETSSTAEREALTALRDFWEDRFFNLAGGDEASASIAARIKDANEKYRVQKLLESSGVLKGEEVNYKLLANAAQRQFKPQMLRNDFTDGRGRRLEPDTVNLIESLQVIRDFPSLLPNSGTPTGAAMLGGPGKAAQSILKSKAGAELYFSNLGRSARSAAGSRAGQIGLAAGGAGWLAGGQ